MSSKKKSPLSYEKSTLFQSSGPLFSLSGSTSYPTPIIEDDNIRSGTEKQDFDLKMKVYHLEETIRKLEETEHRKEFLTTHAQSEVSDLKLKIEELTISIEQRDLLMVKASNIITTLKQENESLKASLQHQRTLEERVQHLRSSNDSLILEFKAQSLESEQDLVKKKQVVQMIEQEKSLLEDRLKQTEFQVASLQDHLYEQQQLLLRSDERYLKAQQVIAKLEDETVTAKAQCDLYKIQYQEENEAKTRMHTAYTELQRQKETNEEKNMQKLASLQQDQAAAIQSQREKYEQEIEQIKRQYAMVYQERRESYEKEVAGQRQQQLEEMYELRRQEEIVREKLREEYTRRFEEKSQELSHLTSSLFTERSLKEQFSSDLLHLQDKYTQLEQACLAQQSEANAGKLMSIDYREVTKRYHEISELYRQETLNKVNLQLNNDRLTSQIADLQSQIVSLEQNVVEKQAEISTLLLTNTDYGQKTMNLETKALEYDKVKLIQAKLTQELMDLHHSSAMLKKDYEYSQLSLKKSEAQSAIHQESLHSLTMNYETMKMGYEGMKEALQREQVARQSLEGSLNEQRLFLTPLRIDCARYVEENNSLRKMMEVLSYSLQKVVKKQEGMTKMAEEAMQTWCRRLEDFLVNKNNHNNNNNGDTADYTQPQQQQQLPGSPAGNSSSVSSSASMTLRSLQRLMQAITTAITTNTPSINNKHHHNHQHSLSAALPSSSLLFPSSPITREQHQQQPSSSAAAATAAASNNAIVSFDITAFEPLFITYDTAQQSSAIFIERITCQLDNLHHHLSYASSRDIQQLQQYEKNISQLKEEQHSLQVALQEERQAVSLAQEKLHTLQVKASQEQQLLAKKYEESVASLQGELTVSQDQLAKLIADQETLQRDYAQSTRQVSRLQSEIAHMQQELAGYSEVDSKVDMLTSKVTESMQMIQSLEGEKNSWQRKYEEVEVKRRGLEEERNQLGSEVEKQRILLSSKDELLIDQETRLDHYQHEIDRLRLRQIDPDLALALMSTTGSSTGSLGSQQQMLAQQGSTHTAGLLLDRETWLYLEGQMRIFLEKSEHLLERYERVTQLAAKTIESNRSTATSASASSQHGQQHGQHQLIPTSPSSSASHRQVITMYHEVTEEMKELFTIYHSLVVKVQEMLITDRRILQVVNSNGSTGSSSSSHHHHLAYQQQVQQQLSQPEQFYFPSRRGLTSANIGLATSPEPHQQQYQYQQFNGSYGEENKVNTMKPFANSTAAATLFSLDDLTQQQQQSKRTSPSSSSKQQQQSHHARRGSVVNHSGQNTVGSGLSEADLRAIEQVKRRFNNNSNSGSGSSPSTRQAQQQQQQYIADATATVAGESHHVEGVSNAMNGKQSRRLSKLDQSLHLLAKKLDAFDFSINK